MAQIAVTLTAGIGTLVMDCNEQSWDTGSNTSYVVAQLTIVKNGGSRYSNYTDNTWAINVDGQVVSGSGTYDIRNGNQLKIGPTGFTIGHNADGSRSIGFSCSFRDPRGNLGPSGGTGTSGSMGLTTIPRASTSTFPGGATFDAGTTRTINTNRASAGFTHTILWYYGSQSGTIATGVTDSTSWAVPLSLISETPNSTSGSGYIQTVTYNGGSEIGRTNTGFSITVPANVVPTLTGVNLSEANSTVLSVVGAYTQSLSMLNYTITGGTGVYGSTITGYSLAVAGQTLSGQSGTSGPLNAFGSSVPVVATVTDSRGRTASYTTSIAVLTYSGPQIDSSTFQLRRSLSSGVVSEQGTYVRVDMSATVDSLVVGATQKNNLTYKVYSRQRGIGASYALQKTVNAGAVTFNAYDLTSGYPLENAWEFRIDVIDNLGGLASIAGTLATATVFMHWNSDGNMGIGKFWEAGRGMVDVKGQIFQNDGLMVLDEMRGTFIGRIKADWSSGQPTVDIYGVDGVTVTTTVSAYAPPDDPRIQPGSYVTLQRYGVFGWLITGPYAAAQKYLKQVPLALTGGWILYTDAQPADMQNETYGEAFSIDALFVGSATAGYGYATMTPTGIVHLEGLITRSVAPAVGSVITTIPAALRPARRQIFQCIGGSGYASLAVMPTGEVVYIGATSTGFVGLNGIRYRAAGYGTYTALNSFGPNISISTIKQWADGGGVNDGTGTAWNQPGMTIDSDGVILFEGCITATGTVADSGTTITNIPVIAQQKNTHNVAWSRAGFKFGRVVANQAGAKFLNVSPGMSTGDDVCIAQIMALDDATKWRLVNGRGGWVSYDTNWAPPGAVKLSGVVYAHGLWSSGTIGQAMTTLPRTWRPRFASVIPTVSNGSLARVDASTVQVASPASMNTLTPNTGSPTWYTLDGVSWPAYS